MPRTKFYIPLTAPKTLLIAIASPLNRTISLDSYFEEFVNLVKSAQIPYEELIIVKLREIDPGFFLGKGKLAEVKKPAKNLALNKLSSLNGCLPTKLVILKII
jgi:50S ribosomal subunit-associated GTPase HflX